MNKVVSYFLFFNVDDDGVTIVITMVNLEGGGGGGP